MVLCGQCNKNEATHYCSACGKWLCSDAICDIKSGLESLNKIVDKLYKKATGKSKDE